MIEWSIDAFRACDQVAAIVVAVPRDLVASPDRDGSSGDDQIALEEREGAVGATVETVAGGATRSESVANGLERVETELVAIHDAARPLVAPGLVEALISALAANPDIAGVIPAAPITDTIKRTTAVDRSKAAFGPHSDQNAAFDIEETLDRTELWGAQTPQVFRAGALREALAVDAETRASATDEAMLVERAGGTVLIHPSGPGNLKVTTPLDLKVAELLLAERPGPGTPD
jgi:2-C-methyl-D-erythritol 4-phosphate cytidylyltransferase